MIVLQRLPQFQTAATTALILVGLIGAGFLAGCTKASGTSSQAAAKPADPAAEKAQAIQRVRDNPNMPPAVKEKVIQQIEGKYTPNAAPVPPPGTAPAK